MTPRFLSPDALEQLMLADPSVFLLDVREPKERAAFGSIHRSVNIERDQLTRRLAEFSSVKDSPVVVVCQTGGRSADAARILINNGFQTVYDLRGGMLAWILQRKTVERDPSS